MSGPVWRWEKDRQAVCYWCLNEVTGVFVEGEVVNGELLDGRTVCSECYRSVYQFLVEGERVSKAPAPAYAHR